jgi:hypothetical protein
LNKDQIEHIQNVSHNELVKLRMHKRHRKSEKQSKKSKQESKTTKQETKKKDYLSVFNILLLTLTWLWTYPKGGIRKLAKDFGTARETADEYIKKTLKILEQTLHYLRAWPASYRGRIASGRFEGAIGCVDTFPIFIKRPGNEDERRKFFHFKKKRSGWAYKAQLFVNLLDGRIMDVSEKVYPYGAFSDPRVFRESLVASKLNEHNKGIAPEEDTEDEESKGAEESEEDGVQKKKKGVLHKGLGDKIYQGIPTLFTPFKRYRKRKMTQEEKDYNRELSGIRSVVEQVNKRMEDFGILGGTYRGEVHDEKEAELVSLVVKVIASLVNYKLESEPIRRSPRTIKHPAKK